MKYIYPILIVAIFLIGCQSDNTQKHLIASTGKINSVAVVIDNQLWKSAIGDTLRSYLASPISGIPGVQEPLFSIHQIPPSVFKGNTRSSRNVVIVSIDKKGFFATYDTLFAKPQKVVYLLGEDTKNLIDIIRENADEMVSTFKKNELIEAQTRFLKSPTTITQTRKHFGIDLRFPSVYKLVKEEDKFLWIERKIKGGTANIIIYEKPLEQINTIRYQGIDAFYQMRDSIGNRYIPGREEGMYMITEQAFTPIVVETKIAKQKAIEIKGLWEMKNFMLGGPFINYIIEDKPNNRSLILEGFVLAPGEPKRDYLFEMEAIIKSIKFDK